MRGMITIAIKKKTYDKLVKLKVHPNQPFWEVVEKLVDEYDKLKSSKSKK